MEGIVNRFVCNILYGTVYVINKKQAANGIRRQIFSCQILNVIKQWPMNSTLWQMRCYMGTSLFPNNAMNSI